MNFNELSTKEKWLQYKNVEGKWVCPKCKRGVGQPRRCYPFPGSSLHCLNCNTLLTRRTRGIK